MLLQPAGQSFDLRQGAFCLQQQSRQSSQIFADPLNDRRELTAGLLQIIQHSTGLLQQSRQRVQMPVNIIRRRAELPPVTSAVCNTACN